MKPRVVNPIDVVEAAYALDGDERTWLARLATLVQPLLDDGMGIVAYPFDVRVPIERWFLRAVVREFDHALMPLVVAAQKVSPQVMHAVHMFPDALMTMADQLRRSDVVLPPQAAEVFDHVGARDGAALQTVEPGGRGVLFSSFRREVRPFDRRTRALWRRVSAHIAAGRRLRAALAAGGGHVDAVLTPDGRVEHAEGDGTSRTAREALRRAVLHQEHARGRARRDEPEEATGAWTALVTGRWSLVDHFERGGRRYLVARRNELELPDPRALTPREHATTRLVGLGKANKLIAYELGVSESTVATHLASAMRKLGARTRVDLVALVAQLGEGP